MQVPYPIVDRNADVFVEKGTTLAITMSKKIQGRYSNVTRVDGVWQVKPYDHIQC